MGCHYLLQGMKVKRESEVAQSCPLFATPWTAALQAPPALGFSRQEHWSGLPLPAPVMPNSPNFKVPKVYDLATASVNKVLLKTATLIASILVVVAFTLF